MEGTEEDLKDYFAKMSYQTYTFNDTETFEIYQNGTVYSRLEEKIIMTDGDLSKVKEYCANKYNISLESITQLFFVDEVAHEKKVMTGVAFLFVLALAALIYVYQSKKKERHSELSEPLIPKEIAMGA